MAKHRAVRLAQSIKEEFSRMLREDIKDPRLGFVTVTDVEVAEDLRYAKIFVSILGQDQDVKNSMEVLNHASGYVRSELGKTIRIRHIPEVSFHHDQSIKHGDRISKLLRDIGVKGESANAEYED